MPQKQIITEMPIHIFFFLIIQRTTKIINNTGVAKKNKTQRILIIVLIKLNIFYSPYIFTNHTILKIYFLIVILPYTNYTTLICLFQADYNFPLLSFLHFFKILRSESLQGSCSHLCNLMRLAFLVYNPPKFS